MPKIQLTPEQQEKWGKEVKNFSEDVSNPETWEEHDKRIQQIQQEQSRAIQRANNEGPIL